MNKEYYVNGTIVTLRNITTSQFHLRSPVILAEPTNTVFLLFDMFSNHTDISQFLQNCPGVVC